jgi:hypothetical protein
MRPTSIEVKKRLFILKFVIFHSILTPPTEILNELSKWTDQENAELNQDMQNRAKENIQLLKKYDLWNDVSPNEKEFFESYGVKMDTYMQLAASWRMEAAGMLMWCLNLLNEWPKIDEELNPDLIKDVEIRKIRLWDKPTPLRDKKEIDQKRDLIEFWHWRVRTRQLIEENRPFPENEQMKSQGFHSFDDIVRVSAKKGFENGGLEQIMDDDFVFKGKPFRDLSRNEYQNATSIIMERHYALNWVCGLAPSNQWDETPTET